MREFIICSRLLINTVLYYHLNDVYYTTTINSIMDVCNNNQELTGIRYWAKMSPYFINYLLLLLGFATSMKMYGYGGYLDLISIINVATGLVYYFKKTSRDFAMEV